MGGIFSLNLRFVMPRMQQLDGYCKAICTLLFVRVERERFYEFLDPFHLYFPKSLEEVFKASLEDGFGDIDHDFAYDGHSHSKFASH